MKFGFYKKYPMITKNIDVLMYVHFIFVDL